MIHFRHLVLCSLVLFLLAMTSCALQTKTPDLAAEKLRLEEQDKRTGEVLREASRMTESGSRKEYLRAVEDLYRNVIDTYQESRLMPECYVRLLSLYLTDYEPPAFGKAEALRKKFLQRYPAAPMKRTIDEKLARAYAAHAEWEKLRRLYLPAIRRFIEAWQLVEPFDMLMYSEAKFNLGDHEEARKGYNIVIRLFPESNEREIAQARIDALHAQTAGTPSVRPVQSQSEQVISSPIAPSGAPLPPKDLWKEVVAQNGDRSWVAVGPGTPPLEPAGRTDVPALREKEGQPQPESSTPVAAVPPDIQPPPENLEEKVRMKDNGRSAISIISETPPERVLDRQNVSAHKQREGLTPAAQEMPAAVMSAAPQPLERSAKVASATGNRELPLLTEEADLRYSVQVGFFRNEKNALALADTLKRKGYDAHLRKHVRADRRVFFRVLVGHFHEEKSAVEHAGEIRQKEGLNCIIFDKAK